MLFKPFFRGNFKGRAHVYAGLTLTKTQIKENLVENCVLSPQAKNHKLCDFFQTEKYLL